MLKSTSPYFTTIIILFFTLVGLVGFYASKLMNIQKTINTQGISENFYHPYMQTFTMFIGQFLCLLIYLIIKRRNPQEVKKKQEKALTQGKKININKFILAIPTTLDFISTNFTYIALNFIPPSVYSMLGGGTIITTLLFLKIFLKKEVKSYQFVGCLSAFLGMVVVGSQTIIFSHQENKNYKLGLQILGIIMMVASLFLSGLFYVVQQKILDVYYIEPLQMVGYQGIFGMLYCIIIIPILTFTPCPFQRGACVLAENGNLYIQRPQLFFKQFAKNGFLAGLVIISIVFIGLFNFFGLTITKYIGATVRPLMGLIRLFISWILSLIITVTIGKSNSSYQWEYTGSQSIFLQLIGFMLICFGICTYNKTFILNCFPQSKKQSQYSQNNSQNQLLLNKQNKVSAQT